MRGRVVEEDALPLEETEEGLHDGEVVRTGTRGERFTGFALKGRKEPAEAHEVVLSDAPGIVDAFFPEVIEEARQDLARVLGVLGAQRRRADRAR